MIGIIILVLLVLTEVAFFVIQLLKKKYMKRERAFINLGELVLFVILIATGIITWGFQWMMLLLVFVLLGIFAFIALIRKSKEKPYQLSKTIGRLVGRLLLIIFACIPTLLFPQYKEPTPTGSYAIATAVYTWTDESRIETFETDGSKRDVTVQFWYPQVKTSETFPLVVFSHGAFGYRMSNYSTYAELVSNGYIVCSIDHPYHSFFTKQTDGKTITVNPQFIQDVLHINEEGVAEDYIFDTSREWMELRSGDMNFVLDTIKEMVQAEGTDEVFVGIDLDKIGVMGHSMGGATSVSLGRERDDVDAVIDLDGTMLGEQLTYENGAYTHPEEPYPVPLLCIDTTSHYEEGLIYGDLYVNNVILSNALDGREVHFDNAGHLNLTDLPLYSPTLAAMLGTGTIDPNYCIETMNSIILEYYNYYLKGASELDLKTAY